MDTLIDGKLDKELNIELSDLKYALDESCIIAITDEKGTIQFANKKFCELSKYSKEELLGQNHRILNSGYHSKEFFRNMWKTISSGKVWRGEVRNRAKDGSFYWVHTTIVPILNELGKPYRYITLRVDITEQKQMEAKLQKALKDEFNQTVNHLDNGVFKLKKDEDGNFIFTMAEGKLLQKLGFNTATHKNKTLYEVFPIDIATFKEKEYQRAFNGSRVFYEIELGGRLLSIDVTPIKESNRVIELVGYAHDITELRSTQKKLEENQLLYQSLFEHSQDAVFSFDTNAKILSMNPATEKLLGYSFEEFKVVKASELIVEKYLQLHHYSFKKALKGEPQNFDIEIYHRSGESIYLNLTYLPILVDQQVTGIYTIGKDITERKKAQKLNAYLAHHDELTKLLNRRGFEDKLNKALDKAKQLKHKLAVMYIDLDRFKNINDTLGHYIGDQLLEQLALRLNTNMGEGHSIARMGGDEFMVLCSDITSEGDAMICANNLLAGLGEPFFIEGNELYVTASIGISIFPENGSNVIDLMKHADIALYRAKDHGRNNFQIYSAIMDKSNYQTLLLERDLRKALNNDEFVFHFQPRIDSVSRKMIGAEALIRWQHPVHGLLAPSEFIPLAEETGLITQIGDWVKGKVCEQLIKWKKAGVPVVPISINISPQSFLQKDFAENFRRILAQYGVEGNMLEIEITENSLMKNEDMVIDTINELKKMGIKIFIDDFGTGYSSFSYFKTFKIDGIKIDRSFIRNISCQSENAGITAAMIQLAQLLNMNVVAEGVETEEELLFLHHQKCSQVQGFLFSKPLQIGEFEELLLKGF